MVGDRTGRASRRAHYELVRVLAEAASVEEATHRLLRLIGESFGWSLGALWMVDEAGAALRHAESWTAADLDPAAFAAMRGRTFRRGEGLPGRVWASGEPAWVSDVVADSNFPRAPAAAASGLHAGVALPVLGREGVLGAMEFFAPGVLQPDPDQLELMRAVGRQMGQFIERRRAEELLRAADELRGAILDAALDCVILIDAQGRIADFNPAAEATFGHPRDRAVGAELGDLIVPMRMRAAHRAALRRCVTTGEGRILGRRLELAALRADGTEFPVELTVARIGTREPPMFAGFVRDITDRRRAREDYERVLRAEQEARVRAEAAERDARTLAQTLQEGLMPPTLPAIPGVELAAAYRAGGEGSEVGGDFYDVFPVGDGWGLAIGDVCGKGARAAAVTAAARHSIRIAARYEESPAAVLAMLNDTLLERGADGDFCTAVHGRLDLTRRPPCLTLAAGGHPLPLVVRADGATEAVGQPGTLLGVVADPQLADAEVALAPGDALLLYTDGLVETRTPEGWFGVERLRALLSRCGGLSAAELVGAVESEVVSAPGHRSDDDFALLALRAV